MTGDHDTSDGEALHRSEPSPVASDAGGGALISRTAPADRAAEERRWSRLESLFRCLTQRYGRPRALAIMRDEDAPSNADPAKWQAFGS